MIPTMTKNHLGLHGDCTKCGYSPGNNWSQCAGLCIHKSSPYYKPSTMREMGAVIDVYSTVTYWHLGDSGGSIDDSKKLWDEIWKVHKRGELAGFAHTHPGSGVPSPSSTDLSTFAAIESGLGKRLNWWVSSSDVVKAWHFDNGCYMPSALYSEFLEPPWVKPLRLLSNYNEGK